MVSGRHRTARPVTSRRVSGRAQRPRFEPNIQRYSHINLQRATADEAPTVTDNNKEEDFVRKESLQVEIDEQLLCRTNLASNPSSPTRPRTFAEATMSTRSRGRGGRKDSLKGADATLNGPMSLESLGPFKYTFKKKKKANKWSPFDLATADSASEVGSISEVDVTSSRAVSPNPQSILGSASFPSSPRKHLSTPIIPIPSPIQDKAKGRLIEEGVEINGIKDNHQIPTQNSLDFTPLVPAALDANADTGSFLDSTSYNCSLDEVESVASDSQSTKDRTEAAMASIAEAFGAGKLPNIGEDAFDSVEWDPDLPSASAPDSPDIVPVAPKPVSYTTVGSIVKNATPMMTAPNRIQREGAGRRPLLPYNQSRPLMPIRHQEASYFNPREPPPPLNMQSSMQYTQQLAQSPVHLYQPPQPASSHSSPSTISLQQLPLSEEEQTVLKILSAPRMVSGNNPGSPGTRNPSSKLFATTTLSDNKPTAENPLPKLFTNNQDAGLQALLSGDLFGDDGQRRSTNLSGLEKMQTIQRLAKFENPMQELARSRLSALSVTNCLGRTVANPNGLSTSLSSPPIEPMSRKVPPGELDRSYQFPPPGFAGSLTSQTNSLYVTNGTSTLQMPSSTRSLGIPRPLTAGPPGQRHYLGATTAKLNVPYNELRQLGSEVNTLSTSYDEYPRTTASQSQVYSSSLTQPTASNNPLLQSLAIATPQPATPIQEDRPYTYDGDIVGSRLVDTLPVSVISQYYPYGFPSNMDGKYKSLTYKMMVKMGQIPGVCEPITPAEKTEAREKEMDNWFYEGQQKLSKTIEDHINDMEQREGNRRASPFGAIGPPAKKSLPPVEKKPFTIDEMTNMTLSQATAPLLDAAFGTLLAYADRTSESRAHLSGWERSPDWLIDSSNKGNISFFGEDWGPPPSRVGGARKLQAAFHNPVTTHWE